MPNYSDNHEVHLERNFDNVSKVSPGRPSSALLRGVKITEFSENKINPEPVTLEEFDFFVGDALSPAKLRNLTGCDDLTHVETLELKVNTSGRSLGNLGGYLPNLKLLKLSHSCVPVVRDLGSCLRNLRILHMCRSGVTDLDGLPMLVSLRELYLAYNDISDISSCGLLEHLTVLDLEGNNVSDLSQLSFLGLCSKLSSLTLEGNPICVRPQLDSDEMNYNYREAVSDEIPQLKVLDGKHIPIDSTKTECQKGDPLKCKQEAFNKDLADKNLLDLQEDWDMLYDLMEDDTVADAEDSPQASFHLNGRPMTQRPLTSQSSIHRPGSSMKAAGFRSSGRNIGSSPKLTQELGRSQDDFNYSSNVAESPTRTAPDLSRQVSTPRTSSSIESGVYSASHLEFPALDYPSGVVFCGNLARAMRFRKQPTFLKKLLVNDDVHDKVDDKHELPACPKERVLILDKEEAMHSLDCELEDMKNEIKKSIEHIRAKKSPQVLKISHDKNYDDDDDAICLSDDGDFEDEVTSLRKDKQPTNDVSEKDRKRESLESFADYFIELASNPIDAKSKQFEMDSDLAKYFDKELEGRENVHNVAGNDIKLNPLRDDAHIIGQNIKRCNKSFANPLEMPSSSSVSANSMKNKKDGVRLNPLLRKAPKQGHDFSVKTSRKIPTSSDPRLLPFSDATTKRSSSTMSPLHHKTVMKAASQYLKTGQID